MTAVIDRLHRPSDRPSRSGVVLPTGRVGRVLRGADVTRDHVFGLLLWSSLSPVVATVAGVLHGWFGAATVVAVAIFVPAGLLGARRGRRAGRLVAGLPQALDQVARSLRSGASFRQSLDEAAGQADDVVSDELRYIVSAAAQGRPIASVISDWASLHDHVELRLAAAALALAAENEAGTSRALDGVSQTLRDRRALRAEVQSLTAQASASMFVLVVMPIGLVVLGLAMRSDAALFLFSSGAGRACLISGLTLDALGWVWMRRLVRSRMP